LRVLQIPKTLDPYAVAPAKNQLRKVLHYDHLVKKNQLRHNSHEPLVIIPSGWI
jgi:hypothetical protein